MGWRDRVSPTRPGRGPAGLVPLALGGVRPAPLPPAALGRPVGQGIPGKVGDEPVEPPGAARRIGAGRLHRIANRRETTLEPDPVVARKVRRSKKSLRHKQPPGHPVATLAEPERRRLELPYNSSPCSHIAPVNING